MTASDAIALLGGLGDHGVDACVGGGDGTIHYGSALDPYTFPAEALAGSGVIAGTALRCESPEWAVRWRTGYPPRPADRHDVPLLCERFGIPRPPGF